jgi:GT2 family glycosyltransferase
LALPKPIVSVVMAVRNGAEYVGEAVDSVRAQTFPDFELIVVDDGSTDRTPEILAEAAGGDERIRMIRQPQGGVSRARNRGCTDAAGKYLAILDADDVAMPTRLELQVPFLDSRPEVAVVGGAGTLIDEDGRELGTAKYPASEVEVLSLLNAGRTPLMQSAATIRADAFRAASGYRPVMEVAQDYDLWLRIAERGQITNIPEPVVRYRIHGGQASTRDFERTAIGVCVALAAARRRQRGEPDPLDAAELLDLDLAESLGVDRREVTDQAVDYALWLARSLARGGRRSAAAPLWSWCAARAGETSDPRATRKRVLGARADAQASEGRTLRALALRFAARVGS